MKLKHILNEMAFRDYEEHGPHWKKDFSGSKQYGGNLEQVLETVLTQADMIEDAVEHGKMDVGQGFQKLSDLFGVISMLKEEMRESSGLDARPAPAPTPEPRERPAIRTDYGRGLPAPHSQDPVLHPGRRPKGRG